MMLWDTLNLEAVMKTQRIKISLLFIPAFIVLGFEYLRHTYCIPYVSLQTGNWLIGILTAISISLISQRLFRQFEQAERSLSTEREARAVMEERERLARELHDQIAQSIFFMGVQVESFRKTSHHRPLESTEWDDMVLALREMDENVRQAIFNLRQEPSKTVDFRVRIEKYLENALYDTQIRWKLDWSNEFLLLPPAEQIQLFGILQEAIMNIRKHASATEITIEFSSPSPSGGPQWSFAISDNGVGFDPSEHRAHQYGLDIVMNRAKDLGAKALIHSSAEGTQIEIIKP
jgi:signal transduction histidine kinase